MTKYFKKNFEDFVKIRYFFVDSLYQGQSLFDEKPYKKTKDRDIQDIVKDADIDFLFYLEDLVLIGKEYCMNFYVNHKPSEIA